MVMEVGIRHLPTGSLLVVLCLACVFASRPEGSAIPVSCSAGTACVVPCRLTEQPRRITWIYDGIPIQAYPSSEFHQHHRFKNRTFLSDHGPHDGDCSVTILDMEPQDGGFYTCCITSPSGYKELLYNISVFAVIEKVTIVQSGDLLICSAEGIYTEPVCRWSHAPSNSSVEDHGGLFSISCPTRRLQDVTQYRCTVSTAFDSTNATYTPLPPISLDWRGTTLGCGSFTDLSKTIDWRFNNNETIATQTHADQGWKVSGGWRPFVKDISESGTLILKNLRPHHLGLYICVHSKDSETHTIAVQLEAMVSSMLTDPPFIFAALMTIALTIVALLVRKCVQSAPGSQPESDPQSSSPLSQSVEAPPPDKYHAALLVCGLLGLGSGLPWHFLVMSLLYLQHRNHFGIQDWIYSIIVLVYQVARAVSFSVVPRSSIFHTLGGSIVISLSFVVMFVLVHMNPAANTFVGVSLCALWLATLSFLLVLYPVSLDMTLLPSSHSRSFAHGHTSAGIIAPIFLIVFVAVTSDDVSPVSYHLISAVVASLATAFAYCLLPRLKFTKHYFSKHPQTKETSVEMQQLNDRMLPLSLERETPNYTEKVLKLVPVVLVQLLTFCVYPGITAAVHTTYFEEFDRYLVPVYSFLIFNLFEFFGQILPIMSRAHKHFRILFPILVILHLVLIILIMFCTVQLRSSLRAYSFIVIDVGFAFVLLLFSLSHGFLTCLTLQPEPNAEEDNHVRRRKILAGALGSIMGTVLSFALRSLISSHL